MCMSKGRKGYKNKNFNLRFSSQSFKKMLNGATLSWQCFFNFVLQLHKKTFSFLIFFLYYNELMYLYISNCNLIFMKLIIQWKLLSRCAGKMKQVFLSCCFFLFALCIHFLPQMDFHNLSLICFVHFRRYIILNLKCKWNY